MQSLWPEVHGVGVARLRALNNSYSGSVEHHLLSLTDGAILQLQAAEVSVLQEYISILSTSAKSGGEYIMKLLVC